MRLRILLFGLWLASPAAAQPHPLTLQEAVDTAREHAPELRQAAAATEAARARVDSAGAPLLPQVTGTANYARATRNGLLPMQSHTSLDTRNSFSLGMRATQLIYDFGQVSNLKAAAKQTALAQSLNEHALQLEIDHAVRSAFLIAGANKALAEVARATLANQLRHMTQIQGFVDVGTRPPIDLAQARTDVGNAQLAVLRADNAYTAAKAALRRAMGLTTAGDYEVSDELPGPEADEAESGAFLLSMAQKARPEIAALRAQVSAQTTTLDSIKGQYGPTLNAVASADENGYQLSNMAFNASVGLQLNWPIFQGGLTNARVAEARALLSGLHAQLDTLHEDLRLSLTQAALQIKTAQAALQVAEDLVGLARERLKLAEGRYATGVGNTIELGDAQLALRDAQTQRVSAEYDLALARVLLRRGLGRP